MCVRDAKSRAIEMYSWGTEKMFYIVKHDISHVWLSSGMAFRSFKLNPALDLGHATELCTVLANTSVDSFPTNCAIL